MFHFDSLIDPTQFGTVRQYLNASRSPITDVLFVREENLLGAVAELLTSKRGTAAHRNQFARWIREGQLKVGVRQIQPARESSADGRVDVDSIPDHARCRVLFLPPYYLVHLGTPMEPTVSNDRGQCGCIVD